jgi:hypothetical protein
MKVKNEQNVNSDFDIWIETGGDRERERERRKISFTLEVGYKAKNVFDSG